MVCFSGFPQPFSPVQLLTLSPHRTYILDGIYQSAVSFFFPFLVFAHAKFVTMNGLDVADRVRLGAYIVHPAVITINLYIIINTYRWDWLTLIVLVISDLSIFFWTAVYSSTTQSGVFYQSAAQVYSQASFWAVTFITPIACIFPRFAIKAFQKVYFPYDVDIIREQVQRGEFDHLMDKEYDDMGADGRGVLEGQSSNSSNTSKKSKRKQPASVDDDKRPIYPPSVATHNTRTQNGSDGTNCTRHETSLDLLPAARPSIERPRPSYDRIRASMDRVRPSYEASSDFTSAARLTRIESMRSTGGVRRFGRLRGLSLHRDSRHPESPAGK